MRHNLKDLIVLGSGSGAQIEFQLTPGWSANDPETGMWEMSYLNVSIGARLLEADFGRTNCHLFDLRGIRRPIDLKEAQSLNRNTPAIGHTLAIHEIGEVPMQPSKHRCVCGNLAISDPLFIHLPRFLKAARFSEKRTETNASVRCEPPFALCSSRDENSAEQLTWLLRFSILNKKLVGKSHRRFNSEISCERAVRLVQHLAKLQDCLIVPPKASSGDTQEKCSRGADLLVSNVINVQEADNGRSNFVTASRAVLMAYRPINSAV